MIKIDQKVIEFVIFDGKILKIGNDLLFVLFGGMNVLEFWDMVMIVVEKYVMVIEKFGIFYVFKVLFDKVNWLLVSLFCGLGLDEGLKIFQEIKSIFNVLLIIDVYELE